MRAYIFIILAAAQALVANTAYAIESDAIVVEKKAEEQVRRYDANHDGIVTYEEFSRVLVASNPNIPQGMGDIFARTAFSKIDKNGDGKLDKLEFSIYIARNS